MMIKPYPLISLMMLTLLSTATVASEQAFKDPFAQDKNTAQNSTHCRAMVYINVSGQLANLKSQPNDSAEVIAQLHNHQYLCVVQDDEQEDGWLLVKAVPFANGKDTLCGASDKNPDCSLMGNFPIVWLKQPQSTKDCRLRIEARSEQEQYIFPIGNCVTGWLHRQQVRYFAD